MDESEISIIFPGETLKYPYGILKLSPYFERMGKSGLLKHREISFLNRDHKIFSMAMSYIINNSYAEPNSDLERLRLLEEFKLLEYWDFLYRLIPSEQDNIFSYFFKASQSILCSRYEVKKFPIQYEKEYAGCEGLELCITNYSSLAFSVIIYEVNENLEHKIGYIDYIRPGVRDYNEKASETVVRVKLSNSPRKEDEPKYIVFETIPKVPRRSMEGFLVGAMPKGEIKDLIRRRLIKHPPIRDQSSEFPREFLALEKERVSDRFDYTAPTDTRPFIFMKVDVRRINMQ